MKMKVALEVRTGGRGAGQLRAHTSSDGGPRIGGLGIPTDQWSDDLGGFKERVASGAFRESIENDDIRAIFNHDSNFVLGRKSAGTLTLTEDQRGVVYEARAPDTTWARDLAQSIERGDIRENSFGFMVPAGGDSWEERDGILWRTVTKAQLREIGPQTFPAYPQSDVQVRSIEETLCVGRACVRSGADPDVLARELDLDRRRPRAGGQDPDVVRRRLKVSRRRAGQDPDVLLREFELDRRNRVRPSEPQSRTTAPVVKSRPRPTTWELPIIMERSEGRRVRAIAYHEAGHAVAFVLGGTPLAEVRLHWKHDGVSWKSWGGRCAPRDLHALPAHAFLAGEAAVDLAGLTEAVPHAWSAGDRKEARQRGWYPGSYHAATARAMLMNNWRAVRALADVLCERQTIPGREAEALIYNNLDPAARSRIRRVAA